MAQRTGVQVRVMAVGDQLDTEVLPGETEGQLWIEINSEQSLVKVKDLVAAIEFVMGER